MIEMVSVDIHVRAWSDVDYYARYHALSIDEPLDRFFWETQPAKIIGVSPFGMARFEYGTTVELEPGEHTIIYGNSSIETMSWKAELYINGELVATSNNVYRGNPLVYKLSLLEERKAGFPWVILVVIGAAAAGAYLLKKKK